MSTPEHPHRLREEQAKGAGGEYVAARYAQMRCDGNAGRCKLPPIRAPRLVVPARSRIGELDYFYEPIWKFTTLHYCERHKAECTIEALLDAPSPYGRWTTRRDIETVAKRKWPHALVPDFDRAWLEWLLTTTPEYRRFLEIIEESAGIMVDPWQGVPVL